MQSLIAGGLVPTKSNIDLLKKVDINIYLKKNYIHYGILLI